MARKRKNPSTEPTPYEEYAALSDAYDTIRYARRMRERSPEEIRAGELAYAAYERYLSSRTLDSLVSDLREYCTRDEDGQLRTPWDSVVDESRFYDVLDALCEIWSQERE